MPTRGEADGILHAEIIAARIRPGDGGLAREEAGHGEPRQRRVALNGEFRVEVAERRRRLVDARAELADVGRAQLVDRPRAQRPGMGDVDVVLIPPEIPIDPRDVAGARQRLRVDTRQMEVAQCERLCRRELMIDFQRCLVGPQRIGSAHLVKVFRQVRQRHVFVLNRLRRLVDAPRRDEASGKGLSRDRVLGFAGRLRKVAGALERRRHHRRVPIVRLLLTQTRVAAEEEGLAPGDGTAKGSAELVAIERVVRRRRARRRPARRVQRLVAEELEAGAVEVVRARLGHHVDDTC